MSMESFQGLKSMEERIVDAFALSSLDLDEE